MDDVVYEALTVPDQATFRAWLSAQPRRRIFAVEWVGGWRVLNRWLEDALPFDPQFYVIGADEMWVRVFGVYGRTSYQAATPLWMLAFAGAAGRAAEEYSKSRLPAWRALEVLKALGCSGE